MKSIGLLLGLGLLAAVVTLPGASANTMPCEIPPRDPDLVPDAVEHPVCAVVGIALHVAFETAQCALTGDSDICVLP